MLSRIALLGLFLLALTARAAEPLSKSYPIDFFRDVPSRNLKGLATRSDGELVLGPTLTDLNGPALPQLLWCLEPAGTNRWLVGSGPEGKILELSLQGSSYTVREIVQLDQPQVLALKVLTDGSILAGTSPNGVLSLVRDGKVVAQAALPVDSIFDLAIRGDEAFVATGNPGRIYRVDLRAFAASGGEKAAALAASGNLKAKGISVFGEVRDRNVRRLAWLGDELVAGSAPKGNLYRFSLAGGPPQLLQENRDAEVAALLPEANGDLYAAIVFSSSQGESRINHPNAKAEPSDSGSEHFSGRSSVVYFPKGGFPETVVTRSGLAFYALARHANLLLIAGGEQGDVLGYDLLARQSLSFAGSDSSQVNALVPVDLTDMRFLALRNNISGIAIVDFNTAGPRTAETRRLDLGLPSRVGALRVAHLVNVAPDQIRVEMRGNLGSDEIEGWTPWTPAERRGDGWIAPDLRGRNVRLRIQVSTTNASDLTIDDATLYYLPQNRRPQLAEFRFAPPNYALIPSPDSPPTSMTLGQLLGSDRDDKRKNPLLNSNVVPQPGSQIAMWSVTDADSDSVACDFSIRREGSTDWIDIAVGTRDGYVQFDTSHLPDGIYETRLVASEQAPRPAADRLSAVFETETLAIDHTPPEFGEVKISPEQDTLRISVAGHDAMSLMDSAEFVFNNGYRETIAQPVDGIRDSQSETFALEVSRAKIAGATNVEIILADAAGNKSSRWERLP